MRCGTLGTSGHVTAKSSIRSGVCFINPASTRGTICVLPWEVSRLSVRTGSRATDSDRPGEVSRGHSRPVAGEAIEAPRCRKAGQLIGRTAPPWDEGPNGAPGGDWRRGVVALMSSHGNASDRMKPRLGHGEKTLRCAGRPRGVWTDHSIRRTAVYVIRMYGGVGGGDREVPPYPDFEFPASFWYRDPMEETGMAQTYTAVVKEHAGTWIGWIEEVPGVNCQEASREELLETLRLTLGEAIELNRADAKSAAGTGFEELPIAVWSAAIWCGTFLRTAAACCARGRVTLGGTIRRSGNGVLCRVTRRSTITRRERSAGIWASHLPRGTEGRRVGVLRTTRSSPTGATERFGWKWKVAFRPRRPLSDGVEETCRRSRRNADSWTVGREFAESRRLVVIGWSPSATEKRGPEL